MGFKIKKDKDLNIGSTLLVLKITYVKNLDHNFDHLSDVTLLDFNQCRDSKEKLMYNSLLRTSATFISSLGIELFIL